MPESTPEVDPHVVNDDYWAPIPEALLYDPAICAEAVRVYGVLRRHGDDPANCFPSYRRIAEFIGASARSIPRWIRELEEAGWVHREARFNENGDQMPNRYRVYSRAAQREGYAQQRGGDTPGSAEPPRQPARHNESHLEPEPTNDTLSARAEQRVTVAFDLLVERDFASVDVKRHPRAVRRACRQERDLDGSRSLLTELAVRWPDWSIEALADAVDLGEAMNNATRDIDCAVCSNSRWSDPDAGPLTRCSACWPIITENRRAS